MGKSVAAIVVIVLFMVSGCASMKKTLYKYSIHNHDEYGITEDDVRKIHNFGYMTQCYEKEFILNDQQIKRLELYHADTRDVLRKYIEVAPVELVSTARGRTIQYVRVVRQKSGGKTGGNVFVIRGNGEYGDYQLLVCIHDNGSINEIYVRVNPKDANGNDAINKDFLDQFIGRSIDQSFELRETPNDYLVTPMKLAGIKDAPVTSRNIALQLRELVAITQVALK